MMKKLLFFLGTLNLWFGFSSQAPAVASTVTQDLLLSNRHVIYSYPLWIKGPYKLDWGSGSLLDDITLSYTIYGHLEGYARPWFDSFDAYLHSVNIGLKINATITKGNQTFAVLTNTSYSNHGYGYPDNQIGSWWYGFSELGDPWEGGKWETTILLDSATVGLMNSSNEDFYISWNYNLFVESYLASGCWWVEFKDLSMYPDYWTDGWQWWDYRPSHDSKLVIQYHTIDPPPPPPPPVPIPGAVWLLGSGLIGLVGLRKKFKK